MTAQRGNGVFLLEFVFPKHSTLELRSNTIRSKIQILHAISCLEPAPKVWNPKSRSEHEDFFVSAISFFLNLFIGLVPSTAPYSAFKENIYHDFAFKLVQTYNLSLTILKQCKFSLFLVCKHGFYVNKLWIIQPRGVSSF